MLGAVLQFLMVSVCILPNKQQQNLLIKCFTLQCQYLSQVFKENPREQNAYQHDDYNGGRPTGCSIQVLQIFGANCF
jgi:hypothetical protein